MKKYLLTATLLCLFLFAKAQTPVYKAGYSIAGINFEYADFLATDNSGNVYVSGRYSAGTDFNPAAGVNTLPTPGGNADLYLAKYTEAGVLVWVYAIGGTGNESVTSMKVDQNGDIYMIGSFTGAFTVNSAGSPVTLTPSGRDAFVLKFSAAGQLLLSFNYGGANAEYAQGLAIASNGDFYVGGEFYSPTFDIDPGTSTKILTNYGSTVSCDPYLAKFTSAGNFIWACSLPGAGDDFLRGMTIDDMDRVLIGGFFSVAIEVDSVSGQTVSNQGGGFTDAYIARYTSAGAYDNAWSFGGSAGDGVSALTTFNNNIIVCGTFATDIDLAPGAATSVHTSINAYSDVFLSCLDPNGTLLWGGTLGGPYVDEVASVVADSVGNVYIVGNFTDSADFALDNTVQMTVAYGDRDGYVAKYTNTGSLAWTMKIGSLANDYIVGFAFTSNKEFWVNGQFIGNSVGLFVDPNNSLTQIQNVSNWDGFFLRYGECSLPSVTSQPVSGGVCPGGDLTFAVTATGTNITYQWQEGTNGGVTWNDVVDGGTYSGATTPTLSLTGLGNNFNNRFYRCKILTDCGLSDTSGIAILFVGTPNTTVTQNASTLTAIQSAATYQWLDCTFNYSVINGATSQTYVAPWNGTYACQLTYNGCVDTSACFTVTTAGLYDLENPLNIKVFPVPAQNVLHVEAGIAGNYSAQIFDLTGRNMSVQAESFTLENTLTISNLASGIYLLGIYAKDGETSFVRFTKN